MNYMLSNLAIATVRSHVHPLRRLCSRRVRVRVWPSRHAAVPCGWLVPDKRARPKSPGRTAAH
eukprot:2275046-Pleurochrysis_carterae.AAC.3